MIMNEKYAQIERENLELKARITSLENNLTQVMLNKGINEDMIKSHLEKIAEIDQLNFVKQNLNTKIEESQKLLKKAQYDLKQSKIENETLLTKIDELSSRLTTHESLNKSIGYDKQFGDTKIELAKLKKEISAKEAENAELTCELFELKSKLHDIDNNNCRHDSFTNTLQNKIQTLEESLKYLTNFINEIVGEDLPQLQKEFSLSDLTSYFSLARQIKDNKDQANTNMKQQLEEKINTLLEEKSKIKTVDPETIDLVNRFQSQVIKLNSRLQRTHAELIEALQQK